MTDRTGGAVIAFPQGFDALVRRICRTVLVTPFTKRTWSELLFLGLGTALVVPYVVFLATTMVTGVVLAVTFFGLAVIALSLRGMRVVGVIQRSAARRLLNLDIAEPSPFSPRPGYFGWLQSALRDRVAWRAVAYVVVKVPLALLGTFTALSVWIRAFGYLTFPLSNAADPQPLGVVRVIKVIGQPGIVQVQQRDSPHVFAVFISGVFLFFLAPWLVRVAVFVDRLLMTALLGPDPLSLRVLSLEHARAETVDASAATLRRIERDLHDGTQAQLVALAMRLGMVKEKLDSDDPIDLDGLRGLVDEAHNGAKEAIMELRDIARGIHPPALDIGLEGALQTLVARSPVPAQLNVTIGGRPTPAIESIAYFCVAELLANVAQHSRASRVSVMCTQYGERLRVVVRDDGRGGAQITRLGSSSSGLAGLSDRVRAVDGDLDMASPPGGPTVVTIDLPLHA